MIRVLHIVGNMNLGGQETFIMNLFRAIDREKICFDFVVHSNERGYYDDEIEKLGGKIYRIPSISSNPLSHMKELHKIIKQNHYSIVHRHTNNSIVALDTLTAKLAGAKKIIVHSHSSCDSRKMLNFVFRPLLNLTTDVRLACSEEAGKWLFSSFKFRIIPNSIDTRKFLFSREKRDKIRRKYSIDSNDILFGNVGAFRTEKNQLWLLNMFSKLSSEHSNFKLMICGDGELDSEIKETIEKLNLKEKVILTGNVDTSLYYSAFDYFLLPSLYEGLGIVLIEAQISGLECFTSDAIQDEAILSNNVHRNKLEPNLWIDCLDKCKENDKRIDLNDRLYENFKINTLVNIMHDIYLTK